MLLQICYLAILLGVGLVSSDIRNNKRCGWMYGNACFPQPTCIDKNLCSSPPFNPICGTALPLCTTRNVASSIATTEKPLPTLPPLATSEQPYYGFKVGAPKLNIPLHREQSLRPMKRIPKIISAPVSSIILKEKEPLRLICSVDTTEDPSTHVQWIREKDNITVGQGEVFLLNNIKLNDAGIYYCKAQNGGSTVAAIARTDVTVQCAPKASEGVSHRIVTEEPGRNVTLICETDCKPEPDFIWYRDTAVHNPLKTCEPASNTMNRHSKRGSFCNLTILVSTHSETLTCLKTNSIGNEKQTFEIKPQAKNPTTISSRLLAVPRTNYDRRIFEAVGCFATCDNCVSNFPELLFIDNGQTEHYGDSLEEYTKQFVHRCAQQSQSRGYDYFGITSYDQCYSGDQTIKTFDRFGKSNTCITGEFKQCTPNNKICIGQCSSIYVYKFKELNEERSRKKTNIQENLFKPNYTKIRRQCSPLKKFLERTTSYNFNGHSKNVSPVSDVSMNKQTFD